MESMCYLSRQVLKYSGTTAGQAGQGLRNRLFAVRISLEFPHVSFDPPFGFLVVGEFLFVAFECGRVVVSAAVDMLSRVGDVEHFVEDDVLDDVSGHVERIERSAYGDVVMRRVVMAENTICFARGPRQDRFFDRVAKIVAVDRFEYLVEIVGLAFRCGDDLSAFRTFVIGSLQTDRIRLYIGRIDRTGTDRDLLSQQFTHEDIREAFVTRDRHLKADRADTDENLALANSNCMIYADIRVK